MSRFVSCPPSLSPSMYSCIYTRGVASYFIIVDIMELMLGILEPFFELLNFVVSLFIKLYLPVGGVVRFGHLRIELVNMVGQFLVFLVKSCCPFVILCCNRMGTVG